MMLFVNILLKLWSLNTAYMLIFLLKNLSSFCIGKYICELDIVLTRTINILTINKFVLKAYHVLNNWALRSY